jgi:hypothetical protein
MTSQGDLFAEPKPPSSADRRDEWCEVGRKLGVAPDPIAVGDAIGDLQHQLREVRLLLDQSRGRALLGSRTCRTCRWFIPRCGYGQIWARRGTGCGSWEE